MGTRGPAPKPTALKVLEGNPGKRALPKAEPTPNMDVPTCPDWLDDDAKAKWDEIVPELRHMGLLSHADGDVLACYCQTWADFKHATEVLREQGTVLKTAKGDTARPEVQISRNSKALLRQLATEFGLTPAARGRMALPDRNQDVDDMEKLLLGN